MSSYKNKDNGESQEHTFSISAYALLSTKRLTHHVFLSFLFLLYVSLCICSSLVQPKELYDLLSDNGVLSTRIAGTGGASSERQRVDNAELDKFIAELEETEFESVVEYTDAAYTRDGHHQHAAYVIAMKNGDTRTLWFTNEAEIEYDIGDRIVGDGLHYYDGATMSLYQRPSRLREEHYCNKDPVENCNGFEQDYGGHGFSPQWAHVPLSALEVKPSQVANGGRGVFAKKFIPANTLLGLPETATSFFVPSSSYSFMSECYEAFDFDYFDTFVEGYIDGTLLL